MLSSSLKRMKPLYRRIHNVKGLAISNVFNHNYSTSGLWDKLKEVIKNDQDLHIKNAILYSGYNSSAINSNDSSDSGRNSNIIQEWSSHCDKEYGGSSKAEVTCVDVDSDDTDSQSKGVSNYIRFSGTLDFNIDDFPEKSLASSAKGGFCAMKGYCSSIQDLRDYQGFEIDVRSENKQLFFFNTAYETHFQGDLYQFGLKLPARRWCRIHLPFSMFKLTAGGMEREYQRVNDSLQLETIGFLLKNDANDENNEPVDFKLDIRLIQAVPVIDRKKLFKQFKQFKKSQ